MPRTIPRSVIVSTGISGSGIDSRMAMIAASSNVFSATPPMAGSLHPFERERDSLADTDAHGGKRARAAAAPELLGRGQRQPRAGHAERVAERDRAAIGVYVRRIVGKAKLAQDREALRGEGFVQFDHVEVRDLEAKAFHQLFRGGRRTDAHDPRRDAGDGGA